MHWRIPALLFLALAATARAQGGYGGQSEHLTEDQIAVAYIQGRWTSPVTCKRPDGSLIQVEEAVLLKSVPEEGGGSSLRATFFGIDAGEVDFCYSLIERRVPDRRGSILFHYLHTHNRKDLGNTDFRRAAQTGSLTYNAADGTVKERSVGANPDNAPTRDLVFDGGDSKLVVEPLQPGSDGAKMYAELDARENRTKPPRRYSLRFIAKDGSEFRMYATEDARQRQRQQREQQ
jgi:hypothetical protein